MKRFRTLMGIIFLSGGVMASPLKVVTTTPDLADLVRQVGGDRVTVDCLSRGFQDPHFVEAKPSLILKVRDADLFVETGLELEIGWAPLLIQGSRNARVQKGAKGYFDASTFITPLEVPSHVSRSEGDVHPGGNPHYLLDPRNGVLVVKGLAGKLSDLDPSGTAIYAKNAQDYTLRLNEKIADWVKRMAPVKGTGFISYHKNLIYFADLFGMIPQGEIEPKPGIPPSPSHTAELIGRMKERKIPLILTMPHFESRTPESLAKATGAQVVVIAPVPDAVPESTNYISTFDYNVSAILKALGK